MQTQFKVSANYLSLKEPCISSFKIEMTPSFKIEKVTKCITVILDVSSSMEGKKIEVCKNTLKELFDYSQKEVFNDKIDLVTFSSSLETTRTYENTLEEQLSIVSDIEANGPTVINPVFDYL